MKHFIPFTLAKNDGYWQAYRKLPGDAITRRGLGGLRCTGCNKVSRHDALVALDQLNQKMKREHHIYEAPPTKLGEYLDVICERRARKGVSPETRAADAYAMRKLLKYLGKDRSVEHLGQADLWRFRERLLSSGLKESSAASVIRSVHTLLEPAVQSGILHQNPTADLPKTSKPSKTVLVSDELVDRALDYEWKGIEEATIVALCALAGCRAKEAMHMTADRVLFGRNRILIPVFKTGHATGEWDRECLMLPGLARRLRSWVDAGAPSLLLHRDRRRAMMRTLRGIGLNTNKPLQAMRQWRASTWKSDATYTPMVVCKWLGHSAAVAAESYDSVPESVYFLTDS